MRQMRQMKRPPVMRTFSQLPTGVREFRYGVRDYDQARGGPGPPPPGFLKATVSATEWMVYWAAAKIVGNPPNPRIGPFNGGPPDWTYQQPFLGGRFTPLGTVPDFIFWRQKTGRPLAIRLQTERWHLFTSFQKQASDFDQLGRLLDRVDVIDIYDYTFTDDPTGQKVIQVLKGALGMIAIPDPLAAGVVQRNRRH